MRVVGVDGCKGGWVAITWDTDVSGSDEALSARVHTSFQALLDAYRDTAAIGVDIPIGLGAGEPRRCDLEARKAVVPKGSSVFPAPDSRFLEAFNQANIAEHAYERALSIAHEHMGNGISKQTFYICSKIAEVNLIMKPAYQDRIVEIHPEVSFWAMAGGRPMEYPKRKQAGYEERQRLLEDTLNVSIWPRKVAFNVARPAKPDDLLEAVVAAWTARRVAEHNAQRLP